MNTVYILFLFFMFLVAHFLLRKALARLNTKAGFLAYVHRYFPVIELVFWAAFAFWAFNRFFHGSSLYLYVNFLILTLGFILIAWFFARDFISGIQVRSRFNLIPGQSFKSAEVNGVIRKMGLLIMEVKAENGSDFKIPYSQLDQKSIELNFQEKSGEESLFSIQLSQGLNETEAVKRIQELIINSPYSSHKSTPVVKVTKSKHGKVSYEISCLAIGKHGTKHLEDLIRNEFGVGKE